MSDWTTEQLIELLRARADALWKINARLNDRKDAMLMREVAARLASQ